MNYSNVEDYIIDKNSLCSYSFISSLITIYLKVTLSVSLTIVEL